MVEEYSDQLESELIYFRSISAANDYRFSRTNSHFLQNVREINNLRGICMGYGETEMAKQLEEKISLYSQDYERFFR